MAAEDIKGILQGREKIEQERIIRWVTESLGLPVIPAAASMHSQPRAPASPLPFAHAAAHDAIATTRPKDIKLFVDEKKPKSDMQFAAVVAYYHSFETHGANRKESITADDLRQAARLAGWKRFGKPGVTLHNAVRQGYLDSAGRGEFRLNAVGENLVAMALTGSGADTSGNNARRPKRKKKSKKLRGRQSKKPSAS